MSLLAWTWADLRKERTLLEDEAVLVLNKPAGIAVVGRRDEPDLVTLARAAGETLLPVHRIDKVASGAILLAKELRIHARLTRQFSRRSTEKTYLAITRSSGLPSQGIVDLPLSVGRKNRVRVAAPRTSIVIDAGHNRWSVAPSEVFSHTRTYPSLTLFAKAWEDERQALLVVRPITGRHHQIRVHLAWIGYPIEGDPLFSSRNAPCPARTYLHSWRLAFDADWISGARVEVEAAPDDDFWIPWGDRLPGGGPALVVERARRASEVLPRAGG